MSRVVLNLALDPHHWRAQDKAGWAMQLAGAAQIAAPAILQVENFEIGDTLVRIHMRSDEAPKRLRKMLRDHEGMKRLRTRLADLGVRPDFEVEEEA